MADALHVKPRGPLLSGPLQQDQNEYVCYGLGSPMQISPTEVLLFLNRRRCGTAVPDFEAGSDAIIFNDFNDISANNAVAISRNETGPHSRTAKPAIFVKYPVSGGFVPLGTKLPDGRPHPHAGTGFGLVTVRCFPADLDNVWADNTDLAPHLELQQYRYDGRRLKVLRTERIEPEAMLADWSVSRGPLRNAIPDNECLIMGFNAGRRGQPSDCGLSRWQYGPNGWRPTEFIPVTGPDGSSEPSLIRDIDSSLLLCARTAGTGSFLPCRVWRSPDNGATWAQVINIPDMQMPAPLSLNNTVDGQPFIAGNPRRDLVKDAQGRTAMALWLRENLCLWPLRPDRTGVETPVNAFDARAAFGPAPDIGDWFVNFWYADHPIGGVFRLADGLWHSLLFFRTMVLAEAAGAAMPSEHTGCRMAEVLSGEGKERTVWRF